MPQKAAASTSPRSTPRTLAGTLAPAPDSSRARAIALYESAITLLHQGKYEAAHSAFTQLLASSSPDLADRIRVYISACLSQVTKKKNSDFANPEEQFDYAVSLLNDGHYDDARTHLESIRTSNPSADYAFYGLAVLASMTGESESCLEHLTEAIRQNPMNRIHARGDSDFQNMADDPRFTDLLYPEV